MYKFICANITKPRNATNSYKKLAHTKKIHQDSSKPQTATMKEYLDENPDETQEYNEEENGGQEGPSTSTSPSTMQNFAMASKLPSFKTLQPTPTLKMKEYPKFYTGNFIIVDPPTPSISKKYYHIYSISPSTITKRSYSSGNCRKFLTDEAKENYKKAMENIYNIQKNKSDFQFRVMNISTKPGSPSTDTWVKKITKKKVPEIRYPTHTIKHNLTLTKRYKIREGSAEGKVQALEEKFKLRKKLQSKSFKNWDAKKVTYPKLVENFKKGKINVAPIRPEIKKEQCYEDYNTAGHVIRVVKNKPPRQEPQEIFDAGRTVEREYGNIDKDFEMLVKSHPTIENASKEVKMKLKTKFIQLLLKTARSSVRAPKTEVTPAENIAPKKENTEVANLTVARKEEPVAKQPFECKIQVSEEAGETTEPHNEASNIVCHPRNLEGQTTREKNYMLVRYPKRVWVDNENTYDLQNICIKDNTTRGGTGLIANHYAKELPKPNYQKVEEEAQELSKFVNKFKHIHHKSDELILKLRKESSDGTSTKLDELKKARLNYIKELEKLNIKLAAANSEIDAESKIRNYYSKSATDNTHTGADDRKADSLKFPNSIEVDNNQKHHLNTLKKREDLEKIRKILTGEMKREKTSFNKKLYETKETKEGRIINPQSLNKAGATKERQDIAKAEPEVNVWNDKKVGQRIFYKNKPKHLNQKNFDAVNKSDSVSRMNKSKRKWPFLETSDKNTLRYPKKIGGLTATEESAEETKQGSSMPKTLMLNRRSEDILNKPLEAENVLTDTVKEQTFEESNKLDIQNNIPCKKKVESPGEWVEQIEVQENDTHMDITRTSLKTFRAGKDEVAKQDAETVEEQNKPSTVQAKSGGDTLDDVNSIDELNERAREAEEKFHKRKSKEEERRKVQMEREKMESWPSNKTLNITPRIDKADDYKDEQYQRGEEAKRKIEQIVPEVHNVRQEESTEYEKLNENVENLTTKRKSSSKRYSLDQPEVKPDPERRRIIRETDLKTEQDQKVKEELDEFYRKKQGQWSNEILEGEELEERITHQKPEKRAPRTEGSFEQKKENEEFTLDDKTQYEELNEIAENLIRKPKRPNKGYTIDHPVVERGSQRKKRIIQENDLKRIQNKKVTDELEEFYKKKRQEWGDDTCKEITDEDNVNAKSALKEGNDQRLMKPAELDHREEHHGYALYPSHDKTQFRTNVVSDKTKLKPNPEELKATGKLRESPAAVHPNVEDEERSTYSRDENSIRKEPKGFEDDDVLEKQTEHLREAVEAMERRKIVSPIIQDTKYTRNEPSASDEYREEVLQRYFEPKLLPGTDQTVYTPKERLIVNNIEEIDDNEEKMQLGQESKLVSDTAVIRRGDEILFFDKNPRPKEMTTGPETSLLHMKLLDKALSIRNEGTTTQNKLLLDTKSKIDEMIDKIKNLEIIIKQKHAFKQEEKKSENKPRIPPPKPPTEKDKKDIKKDKPKGPNDMVLPPKIRGSTPEKRQEGHKETEKNAADQEEAPLIKKEIPVESQILERPGKMMPKLSPEQNLEPKVSQTQNVTTRIRDVKQEKSGEVSINAKRISVQNEKNTKSEEIEVSKKEKITKDISAEKEVNKHAKQGKIPMNVKNNEKDAEKNQLNVKEDTRTDRVFYDPHTEKVRKYFARKYGIVTKSDKSRRSNENYTAEVGTKINTKNKLPGNKVEMLKPPENKRSETNIQKSSENKTQIHKFSENKTQMQKLPDNKPKTQKPSESKMQTKKPPEDKPQSPNRPPPKKPPENNMQMQKPPENKTQMQKRPENNKMQAQKSPDSKEQTRPHNAKQEQKIDEIKLSFVKKVVKTPKSKSFTRAESNANELASETLKALNPTKSAGHLDNGKTFVKRGIVGELVSCSSSYAMRQNSFESVKPVRSSTTAKGTTRTASSRPQVMKIGMRGTKTKYSSWSMQGRTGRQINSPLDHRAVLKKITTDEALPSPWGLPNRSSSDASRRAGGPRKPKVLLNNNYLRRSVSKGRSEDRPKTMPNKEAASKPTDEVAKPVVFTKDNLKRSNAGPSHVQEEQAKGKKQIIELAKVLPENDNVKQEQQSPDLSKALPKIYWADTNVRPQSRLADKHFKHVKPIIELSKVAEKKPSKKQQKNISESPKLSSSYTTPDLCSANNNLRQDKPIGTLNVRLPKTDRKSYLSLSTERRSPGRGTKLPGYSSEAKVLTGKKNPKLTDVMDLDISENKMSIAGISTTPTMKDLDDKDFTGPRKSIDNITEGRKVQKLPREEQKNKTAIFQIQYDGEIFIIKKADETLGEAIDKKKKEQTVSHINPMDGSTKPITELKQTTQYSTDLNREDIVILEKCNTIKQNKNKLEIENEKSNRSASKNQHDSTKSDVERQKPPNTRSAEDSKSKLTAKVEEIIVKPMKDRSHNEGTKEFISEIKLNHYDKAEDRLSYTFQSSMILPKASLRAKIETIYDKHSSTKIRENQKLKKFNRALANDIKPKKWKSLFSDLGAANFQNIKEDFFEHGPTEKVIIQQSAIKTDPILMKHKPKRIKEEDLTLKQSLKDNLDETKAYNSAQGKKPNMLPQHVQNLMGITQETNLLPDVKEWTHHDILQVPSNNTNNQEEKKQQSTISNNFTEAANHKIEPGTQNPAKNEQHKNVETNSMEFTRYDNIYISKTFNATNTTPDPSNNSSTPKTRDLTSSVKETPSLKDISYYGTVKSDCVEQSKTPTQETIKKTDDMYNLNFPKTNPQIPSGSLYTIRVPNVDNDLHRKENTVHKREPSLYRVKILPEEIETSKKPIVTMNPEEVKINKHRNLTFSRTKLHEDHLKMMEPKKSVEILHPKEFTIAENGEITQDKNVQEFKLTYNSTPKVKVAEKKTINVKLTPLATTTPVLKARRRKSEIKIINKAKTEGRIVREKPKVVESRLSTSQLANNKVSRNRSVEKVISKENLISEIEAWVSNTSSVASKRKVKSEQEKVRPKGQSQMRSNLSKRKNIGKINFVSQNKTETIHKPLKTSQSEHVKTVLPENKTDSGKERAKMLKIQEKNENTNGSVRATVGDIRRPVKKYPIDDDDDKFMSVDKSLRRNAQRVLSDLLKSSQDAGPSHANADMMNGGVSEPPALEKSKLNVVKKKSYTYVTKTDEMRKKKKSELQLSTKKHKNEQHVRQQEKRFKKEVVKEMNDTADEIYKKEKRKRNTMIRGIRRQDMRQKDVKVIQPSVGSGPWGTKIKKPPSGNNDDKKNLHDGTNINTTPNKEKLMSKSEFLRLKQQLQAQQNSLNDTQATFCAQSASISASVPNLREIEFQQNIQEIQKYLITKRGTETAMESYKQQDSENRRHDEARPNLTNLGNEINKYLNQKNEHNEKSDKNALKGKVEQPDTHTNNEDHINKQDAKNDLYKRIDQEIETKVKPRAEWPINQSSDTLNFKITKMVEKVANDLRLNEENERTTKVNADKPENKKKHDTTTPQGHSEKENKFGSEQLKVWNVAQTLLENQPKQTKADSVTITKKDFIVKVQSKNVSQSGQPARAEASKGYSETRKTQKSESVDDAPGKSVSRRSSKKLTSSGQVPNSFDTPSMQEKRKKEIEEMMENKSKNKMSRRIKTANLKNMLHKPTHAVNTIGEKSGVNAADAKEPSATKEPETDQEEMGPNIVKISNFIFKPENLNRPIRKNTNIRNNVKTGPTYEDTSKMQKIPCEKIVLPLQNPQVIDKQLIDPQFSTLDKPLMDEIKIVPKEILEAEENAKKASQKLTLYGRKIDPLAKYRHLKITYMTVNRQVKKEDEKFLPALVKKIEERENTEANKNEVINFRFELLRRLNEEFEKQLAEQMQKQPVKSKNHKTPIDSDSDKLELGKSDLEKEIESFTETNMNAAKLLSEIKPVANLEKGLKNIKKSGASNKGGNTKRRGASNSNKTMFPPSKPGSNDENGPGDARRYSTDSTKCVGSDSNDNEQLDSKCEKTNIWPVVSESTGAHSSKNEGCADAEDFNVLEAVPHAFACPSPQLEEHRQENLYYRYHQMTFFDLHQYLGQRRAFAFKAAEKNTIQDQKPKE